MKKTENPFESGRRKVVPAVLVYIRQGDQVLMIHKRKDFHEGKWNGLGGKCELDESPLEAAYREVLEESGLDLPLTSFKSLGTVQFPNFKPQKSEDWIVFVFTAEFKKSDFGYLRTESDEGTLSWVSATEVMSLPLWPGDRHFLPHVLQGRPFVGTVWYEKMEVVKYWIQPLA